MQGRKRKRTEEELHSLCCTFVEQGWKLVSDHFLVYSLTTEEG